MKISACLILLTVVLSGCSSVPEQVSLLPEVNVAQYTYAPDLRISLQTVDERINHYLISIKEKDLEARQLIASGSNIRQQIQQELSDGFLQQQLNQVELAPNIVKVTLLRCHADLTQNNFSYEGSSSVHIKVTVSTPQGDIAKLFKSEKKFEEAFNIDLAKIQSNLNEQLSRALERILADEQIRKTINNK